MAVRVDGGVVGADGLPAVGARVAFQRELLPLAYDDQQSGASAKTDEAGRFQRDLPPGAYRVVIAGWQHDTEMPIELREGQPLELRLGVDWPWRTPPTATGTVRLLDAGGQPVAGRMVKLAVTGPRDMLGQGCGCRCDDPGDTLVSEYYQDRRTDAEGRVRFHVAPGLVTVGAWVGGAEAVQALLVRPGAQLPGLELRLPAEAKPWPGRLELVEPRCRVQVFGSDRRPLARRWLLARCLTEGWVWSAQTDDQGIAEVRGWIGASDWVIRAPGLTTSEPRRLTMRSAAPPVRFDLGAPTHTLRGTVRDEQGQPLAGCWVAACRPRSAKWGQPRIEQRDDCVPAATGDGRQSAIVYAEQRPAQLAGLTSDGTSYTLTASDGSYRLDDLEAGRWHMVFAKRGYLPDEARSVALDGTLDFALRRNRGRLSGVVHGSDGEIWRSRAFTLRIEGGDQRALNGPRWQQVLATDAAGRYELGPDDLPAGACRLTVEPDADGAEAVEVVLSHQVPVELDLSLPEPRVATGRVLLPDGRPAAQAWVGHAGSPGAGSTWTDADGRFSLRSGSREATRLVVFADGCARAETQVVFGTPVEVRLEPGASVVGHLRWPPGARVDRLPVALRQWNTERPWEARTLDTTGAFGLACLPLGGLGLMADLGDDLRAEGSCSVPSTEPLEFAVERIGTGEVSGTVVDCDGKPVAGAEVTADTGHGDAKGAEPEYAAQRRRQVTRRDGRFRFTGLRAVTWHFTARLGDLTPDVRPVTIANDSRQDIVLQPRWMLEGKLSGVPEDCLGGVVIGRDDGGAPAVEPGLWRLPLGAPASYALRQPGAGYSAAGRPGLCRLYALVGKCDDDEGDSTAAWDLGHLTLRPGQPAPDVVLPGQRGALRLTLSGLPRTVDDGSLVYAHLSDAASGRLVGEAVPNTKGIAYWPCLPPGSYRLMCYAGRRATPRPAVKVVAGQTAELTVGPCQGVSVDVAIGGKPEWAWVTLANDSASVHATLTGGAGRLDDVPPGRYGVWVCDRRGARRCAPVTVGSEPLRLELPAAGK